MRLPPIVLVAVALTACGGGERQDAGAPAGDFGIDVERASFPARQTLAEPATLRLAVRNMGKRAVPNLAVTVRTDPAGAGRGAAAFGTATTGAGVADPSRPVWVLDEGPAGGDTAYTDTWALGRLGPGRTRRVAFTVTAVRPGRYRVVWRVAPSLEGEARAAAGGRTRGVFRVTVSPAPVDSRVGVGGRVVRGDGP